MRLHRLALLLSCSLLAPLALGDVHEVKMLNRGADGAMVYEPDHLRIEPGDSVRFVPTQSGHNAASLPGLWPEAAPTFKSNINQPVEYRFATPGLYGIQCIPHLAMGMVMLIQVGQPGPSTGAVPSSLPARAKARLAAQLQRLETGR